MPKKIVTVNPATEEKIKEYRSFSSRQVEATVESSRKVFSAWRESDMKERERLLKRLRSNLLRGKKKYAELITTEMGKPIKESVAEVGKCAWLADYYRKNMKKFLQNEVVKTDAYKSYVSFEPFGVVACIMPWNFPFWQVMRFAIPSITAGNTVVLKHASACTGCGLEIGKIFEMSGRPGVFKVVVGSAAVGEALVRSRISAVSVTGSVGTGKRVASIAASQMKKFVLELGGSDPMIVLGDARLDLACKGAIMGRDINSGQSCIAAKRFIVSKKIEKDFTKKVTRLTKMLVVGDPMDKETDVGPLVREAPLRFLDCQVRSSVAKGARLLVGGRRKEGKGYFYMPTVLSDVRKGMRVADEETFGPVAPIISASSEKEAVDIANDTRFGLGASVWTRNVKKAERIAKKIDAGVVYVNGAVRSDPRMPFGGVKESGVGRELSHYGIREFVNVKSVKVFR